MKDVLLAIEQVADRLYGPLPPSSHRVISSRPQLDLAQVVSIYCEQAPERGKEWIAPAQLLACFKEIDPSFSLTRQQVSTITMLVNAHPELFETRRLPGRGRPMQVRCQDLDLPPALVAADTEQENQ